jgi:thiol-disulfide isomerase/thioredoxin
MTPLLALILLQGPALKVGDPAPPLRLGTWIKGAPIHELQKGKVYVVEFWATWCGPCKANMPHLSALARRMKGKAEVIGVDVWERPPTSEEDVKKFVLQMGDRMDYNVVRDDASASMATTWMKAAGRNGIPSAFVVGRDGKVAWIGHPASRMPEVLEAVVENRYDPAEEAKAQAKIEADRKEEVEVGANYRRALAAGDRAKADQEFDAYFAAHPEKESRLWMGKYQALLGADEPAAYAYAQKLAAGLLKKDAQGLYVLSAFILQDPAGRLKSPDYSLALRFAEQAAALPVTDSRTYVVTTLASALAKTGKSDRAREVLREEITRLEKAKDGDPELLIAAKAALAKLD